MAEDYPKTSFSFRFFNNEKPQSEEDLDSISKNEIALLYDAISISSRLKDAQNHVNLDDSDMKEIVYQYIKDTPVMFENLNNAWKNSNCDDVLLYAHSIVGVAHLLKLDEVGEYAKVIEEGAKAHNCSDNKTLMLLNEHHNTSLNALQKLY